MSSVVAFHDVTCTKCRRSFGWPGLATDRPPCPGCGHVVPVEELETLQSQLAEISDRALQEAEERDDERWASSTSEQQELYLEGQLAALEWEEGNEQPPETVTPLRVPNPYVATKTADGKFWKEHYQWWGFGWYDHCEGVDRIGG